MRHVRPAGTHRRGALVTGNIAVGNNNNAVRGTSAVGLAEPHTPGSGGALDRFGRQALVGRQAPGQLPGHTCRAYCRYRSQSEIRPDAWGNTACERRRRSPNLPPAPPRLKVIVLPNTIFSFLSPPPHENKLFTTLKPIDWYGLFTAY